MLKVWALCNTAASAHILCGQAACRELKLTLDPPKSTNKITAQSHSKCKFLKSLPCFPRTSSCAPSIRLPWSLLNGFWFELTNSTLARNLKHSTCGLPSSYFLLPAALCLQPARPPSVGLPVVVCTSPGPSSNKFLYFSFLKSFVELTLIIHPTPYLTNVII